VAIDRQVFAHRQGWWLWRVNLLAMLLWPVSLLFCGLASLRRFGYQRGWFASRQLPRPVLVVGNLSLGGSGKTPLVVAIAQLVRAKGYKVGVLCRGYKSRLDDRAMVLESGQQDPAAGDEANLLAALSGCPVGVGIDRVRAGECLLERHPDLDLVISDDGLQHYALVRDFEILVKRDAAYGNGWCLPAGPLREPRGRAAACDLEIDRDGRQVSQHLGQCWNLADPTEVRRLESFRGDKVFALAGIGFPQGFFQALQARGLDVIGNAFPDHHAFSEAEVAAFDQRPLLVTHKDAVKLAAFARSNIWVVPLELHLADDLQYRIMQLLESKLNGQAPT
jgi:tetraacyldisaccharide 4'-kinase